MHFLKNTTWEEIFEAWRQREAYNPAWVHCATVVKGFADWESWRRHTAEQLKASQRDWKIFQFDDPMSEIPKMLLGPFVSWQSMVTNKNRTNFEELLDLPGKVEHFSQHEGVISILKGLPFPTDFIGLFREDLQQIVCLEGHHRATAMALLNKNNQKVDFSNIPVTIALANLSAEECAYLDQILERATVVNK